MINKKNIKAILFDMDGVLFDSMPNHVIAWMGAVEKHGLSITREEVYMNEGRTGAGTINTLTQRSWGRNATEQEIEAIYKSKCDIFNTCLQSHPMAGAAEVLNKVLEAGLLPVLVTGSGQKSLLDRLNQAYPFVFRPELMVTAFDVTQGKPFPEPYLKGLAKAGAILNENGSPLQPEQAVVVENAPLGIQAGKAAGIYTIAVNTGPLQDQILMDAGADRVYSSMQILAEQFPF